MFTLSYYLNALTTKLSLFLALDRNSILLMDFHAYLFFSGMLLFFCITLFYYCYKNFLLSRQLEDMPTGKIRSAYQGYIEIYGLANYFENKPLYAPLTKLPCAWYRFQIQRYAKNGWETIETGKSEVRFSMEDGTGICLVDPEGAEITTSLVDSWRGFQRYPRAKPRGAFSKFISYFGSYRYIEERFEKATPIHVLGNFETLGNRSFNDAQIHLETNDLLRQWKEDYHNLLNKYDTNQDGQLESDEWDRVVREAENTIRAKYTTMDVRDPINVMSKMGLTSRQPFIISSIGEKRLLQLYRRKAALYLTSFIVLFVFTLWFVGVRIFQ